MSDPKGDTFVEKIEKNFIGLLDILNKYESIQIPLDAFFQIV
ncbi:MAG: hypothetical protein ACMG6E_08060 [Candidatus Roizmanbacteria bacterium]